MSGYLTNDSSNADNMHRERISKNSHRHDGQTDMTDSQTDRQTDT